MSAGGYGVVRLQETHPSVIESISRIANGDNMVPITAARDFDGNDLLIHVNVPADPNAPKKKLKETFDADRTTAPVGKIHLSIVHNVKVDVCDKFNNLADILDSHFGKLEEEGAMEILENPNKGCTLSLEIDLKHEKRDIAVIAACQLRVILLEAPFFHIFDTFLKTPSKTPSIKLPYRAKETLYVFGFKEQSVSVVTGIHVPNHSDRLFIRNALQSFQDTRKHSKERAVSGGPSFEFSPGQVPKDIPADLTLNEPAESEDYYWVSFGLGKNQLDSKKKQEKTVQQIVNFRNYVHYHVNCLRSQLHQKMRQRVESSLVVLNRAKTGTTGKSRVTIE